MSLIQGCTSPAERCKRDIESRYVEFSEAIKSEKPDQTVINKSREQLGKEILKCSIPGNGIDMRMLAVLTELELAVLSDNQSLISKSFDKLQKCKLCAKDIAYTSALHVAAAYGTPETIKYLIEIGLDVNARDEFGNTPLISAASGKWNDVENIKTLIALGADINASSNNGLTVFIAAVGDGNAQLVRYLLDNGAQVSSEDNIVFEIAGKVGNEEVLLLLEPFRPKNN